MAEARDILNPQVLISFLFPLLPTFQLEKEMAKPAPVFLLKNPMDRGAWLATVHGVAKSQT